MKQLESKLTPLQQTAISCKLLEAEIISRAWADDAFHGKLTADPASALSEAGLPLPEGKAIKVIAENPDTITLILPSPPAQAEEAADEELEAVAGGGFIQNRRCQIFDDSRRENTTPLYRFCAETSLAAGVFIGLSWGWG